MSLILRGFMAALYAFSQGGEERTPPSPSLLSMAKHELLNRTLHSKPERLVSKVAPSGAVSVNAEWESGKGKHFFIEQQRYGADLVQAGLVRGDRALFDQGWKLLKWGFDRQGRDGGFPGTGDPFHSTSLFVEAAARASLLTRQSGWEGSEQFVAHYAPKVGAAAHWLMRPDVAGKGRKNNSPYAHRRWILAAALGETAALVGDQQTARAADDYAREGLSLQQASGINPEKGGGDASYQAVGILMAERFYTVCSDSRLRTEVKDMIVRALRWELTKIDAYGTVSLEGSSRTGQERGRTGTVKTMDYKSLVQALVFATAITGDARYQQAAERVAVARKWLKS